VESPILLLGNNTLWTNKLGLDLHADFDLQKMTFNLSPQNSKPLFFTHKHGTDLLTLLLMFGVDPSLRFVSLDPAIKIKHYACMLFSTRGLEIKHKSNKTYITHAFGTEKVSFY
jgi:hypothetical protein